MDGCAIFYNDQKFKLEDHKCIEFYLSDTNELFNRDNIAIIGIFSPLHGEHQNTRIFVVNNHLLYNIKRSEIKLAQIQTIIKTLENLTSLYSYHYLIFI